MSLYVSQYLNVYPSHRKTAILFGGISGAIDEVEMDVSKALKCFQRLGACFLPDALPSLAASEIEFLKKRGHLTAQPPDEERKSFASYAQKIHELKQRSDTGSLMIVPSYACNLACPYCFQSNFRRDGERIAAKFMTPAEADRIFESVIPKLFPRTRLKNKISICLYGGEPFLPRNEVTIEAIMRHTMRHQMPVTAISNATNLGKLMRWFGTSLGSINTVQISLDGDKPLHDRSRVGPKGEPTFERILENIHLLLDKNVRINLRINITRENSAGVESLAKRLEEEELLSHPKLHAYAWAVHSHCDAHDSSEYLTNWELARVVERSVKGVESPVGRRERRLRRMVNSGSDTAPRRVAYCMRSIANSFLIDPYFDIYGCYEEAGDRSRRVAHFSESGEIVWESSYEANQSRHVANCDPCARCSVALTCGGGCPYAAEMRRGTQFADDCDSHKACVAKAVQRLFKERVENIAGAKDVDDFWDLYPNA